MIELLLVFFMFWALHDKNTLDGWHPFTRIR